MMSCFFIHLTKDKRNLLLYETLTPCKGTQGHPLQSIFIGCYGDSYISTFFFNGRLKVSSTCLHFTINFYHFLMDCTVCHSTELMSHILWEPLKWEYKCSNSSSSSSNQSVTWVSSSRRSPFTVNGRVDLFVFKRSCFNFWQYESGLGIKINAVTLTK